MSGNAKPQAVTDHRERQAVQVVLPFPASGDPEDRLQRSYETDSTIAIGRQEPKRDNPDRQRRTRTGVRPWRETKLTKYNASPS